MNHPKLVTLLCNGSARPAPCGLSGSGRAGTVTPEQPRTFRFRSVFETELIIHDYTRLHIPIIGIIIGVVNCFFGRRETGFFTKTAKMTGKFCTICGCAEGGKKL